MEDCLGEFDADCDGVINFAEFVNMLQHEPWSALLPPGVLPEVIYAP